MVLIQAVTLSSSPNILTTRNMKLALYQQLVKNGEDSKALFNPGNIGSKIFDVKIEGVLRLNSDFKGITSMLSFNSLGCLVYVIKPLFSRLGDYRALVLAIPKQVAFAAAEDIASIVKKMEDTLANGKDEQELASCFEKDYKELDFDCDLPEQRNRYAFRCYGKGCKQGALEDLLGANILQEDYFKYEGVFFIPVEHDGLVRKESMDNLTANKMAVPAVLQPPTAQCQKAGCKAWIAGKEFDKPFLTRTGITVKITLKKDGCVDRDEKVKVDSQVMPVDLPEKIDWWRKIYAKSFSITGEDGPLKESETQLDIQEKVSVNKRERFIAVPESKWGKAHLIVNHDGYEPMKKVVDLSKCSPEKPLVVKLKRTRKKVSYKVAGTKVAFDLERTEEEKGNSPLQGFEVQEVKDNEVVLRSKASRKNEERRGDERARLADFDDDDVPEEGEERSHLKVSKKLVTCLASGLVAGLLVGGASGWFLGKHNGEKTAMMMVEQQRLAKERQEQMRADSIISVDIVHYLDSVTPWKKVDMDSALFQGKLNGFYDALNTYSFETVQVMGDSLNLQQSKNLQKLDSVIKVMNQKPEYKQKLLETSKKPEETVPVFSRDGTITLANFLGKLEEVIKIVDSEKK